MQLRCGRQSTTEKRLTRQSPIRRVTMRIGVLRRLLFFALLIGLWAALAKRGVWDSTLFPSPWQVALTLKDMVRDRTLLTAVQVSLQRVLLGYSISLAFGVPLGMLLARAQWAKETI